MLYFKDEPVSPSQVDAQQLLKVQEFKKEVPTLGSLYQVYKTPDEFLNLARLHLAKQVQDWGKAWGGDITPGTPSQGGGVPDDALESTTELNSELGYLDLAEIFLENFDRMTKITQGLTDATNTFTQKTYETTAKLDRSEGMDVSSRIRYMKRISDEMATELRKFSTKIETDAPLLGGFYRRGTSAAARAATMSAEFGNDRREPIQQLLAPMRSHREILHQTSATLKTFRDTIKRLPGATSAMNAARGRAVTALEKLSSEYDDIERHSLELEKGLEDMIN